MPVALGDREVELDPAVEGGIGRRPDEGAVVAVPGGQHASGPQDPAQLDQGGDRIDEVLEHLMGVHDVEGGVVVAQGEEVAHLEAHVGRFGSGRESLGLRHDLGRGIEADHLPGHQASGQVDRDRPGPAADVEQGEARRAGGAGGSRRSSPPCARCGSAVPTRGARACRS